jgi:hypothetical protein
MQSQQVEIFTPEEVLKRTAFLKRVVKDVVACCDSRRKAKERLEELVIISKKFTSGEIQETINNLRRQITECDRDMEAYEREVRLLGGILKDARRGLVYFYSQRDKRRIFLVWEMRQPDAISWHEIDETFADRTPVEFSPSP